MDKTIGAVGRAIVAAARWVAAFLGLRPALPVHPFTGLTALGVLPSGRPVWPVMGGAPDDDEGEKDDDDGEDDDEQEGDEDDDETEDDAKGDEADKDAKGDKKPADKKAGEETVSRSELKKAVAERQRAKKALREVRAELEAERQKNEGADEKTAREAREAADAAAEKRYKPIAIRAALLEAGVKAPKVQGAARLLDMADIEVDDNGDVTGLDEQLDGLREEWPELFASAEAEGDDDDERRQRRRRVGGSRSVDGADKERKRKPLTASEKQAAQLLGGKS